MKKTHSMLFVPGIIMLGIVLRTPFTTLPTVLSDIAAGFDRDYDRICHSDYQPPLPLSGNHLDWSWHRLSQCAASKPDSSEQTPSTRHSDHFVHHFYGDVHSDRLFCRCSDHQSHFLARFGQHLDSLVCSCFGHLDS